MSLVNRWKSTTPSSLNLQGITYLRMSYTDLLFNKELASVHQGIDPQDLYVY